MIPLMIIVIVYNDSNDMSSFLPVGQQQEQELDAVRNQLNGEDRGNELAIC